MKSKLDSGILNIVRFFYIDKCRFTSSDYDKHRATQRGVPSMTKESLIKMQSIKHKKVNPREIFVQKAWTPREFGKNLSYPSLDFISVW
jgi:hypothetical protein